MNPVVPIEIIDCSLREGLQSPGCIVTLRQSVEIALALTKLGVDHIECSNPAQSDFERDRIRAVAGACGAIPVLTHCRAVEKDIASAVGTGATWVGIFLGINDLSLKSKLSKYTLKDILLRIDSCVRLAKKLGFKVRFTLEDTTRTAMERILEGYQIAVAAGADVITVSDSVGISEPREMTALVERLVAAFPRTKIEAHHHNDRGLALANTLAAIDAGAHRISCSLGGVGERCGITDTFQVLANLHHRKQRPITSGKVLRDSFNIVRSCFRLGFPAQGPVTGDFSFGHSARLHRLAVENDEACYSWIHPEVLGQSTRMLQPALGEDPDRFVLRPKVISATELRYHRDGFGTRYVMLDERFIPYCRQYCVVRNIPYTAESPPSFVDEHAHTVDSLFLFLGKADDLTGLTVEVLFDDKTFEVSSPAAVFIPAGRRHSYRILRGEGFFVNHVLAGNYNESLMNSFIPTTLES